MNVCYSEKQFKDINILLTNIIFEKIFSKHSIFISDRFTNMQLSNMQNKIYGPLSVIAPNK